MRRGGPALRTGVLACVGVLIAAGLVAPVLTQSAGASVVAVELGPRSLADDTVLGVFTPLGGGMGSGPAADVKAIVLQGDDTVYAGGAFTTASGVPGTTKIAAWSNADDTWHAVGNGIVSDVYALALEGDDTLYVGGAFSSVSGISGTNRIAAWSNADDTWHALGTGAGGNVYALASQGDDTLYAGGAFGAAGGVSGTHRVAAWSTADRSWHALGGGADNEVYSLAASGDDTVYAGGSFNLTGSVSGTKRIAMWSNGDDTWHPLGSGLNSQVFALDVQGDDTVYAGGQFYDAGGLGGGDRIAAWSNVDDTWRSLAGGTDSDVYSLAVDDAHGLVYAGGDFGTAGPLSVNSVAVWDTGISTWIPLQAAGGDGIGTSGQYVYAIALDDSVVYLGGTFSSAGGVPASKIAKWTWDVPSAEAAPATGGNATTIQVRGSGLIGVSGVTVNRAPATYTRDDSTTVSVTIPGSLYDGTYEVAVHAVGGTATTSYTVTGSPAPVPPRTPGAPSGVTAVAGDGLASVSWAPPGDSGSFPVSAYEATSTPGGRSCLVNSPVRSCEVSGLVNGTSYTFTVRALNGAGWGAESARSNAVTPRAVVRATIVITGSRDPVDPRMAVVRGVTTGLAGKRVTPYVRFAGEGEFTPGRVPRPVADDGTFDWQRRTARRVVVYFACGAVVSNRVVIPAR